VTSPRSHPAGRCARGGALPSLDISRERKDAMPAASSAPALEVLGLTRRFGDVTAVDDVSFVVEPGRLTGFIGGNGAGKTTTMRMIMGILAIHGGEVRWGGRPITRADRATFGYMPEERGLYPKQQVLDQLAYLSQLRRSEEHTSELRSRENLVCRLLLEKK